MEFSDTKENIDYKPCFAQQDHSTHLQSELRLMITEMTEIQLGTSEKIKKWRKKWRKRFEENKKNSTPYENTCDLLIAATNVGGYLEGDIMDLTEELKSIQELIPEKNEHQSLKNQLKEVHADVDRLNKELDTLKIQQRNLKVQIAGLDDDSVRDKSKRKDRQKCPADLNKQLTELDKSIARNRKALDKSETTYQRKAAGFFEKSQENELKRLQLIQEQLTDFVNSFQVQCDEFNETVEIYDPKTDLSEWKECILQQNVEQPFKSPSIEDENYDNKKYTRQQPVKSRSYENETDDNKKYTRQQSVKPRSPENEADDNKKYTRQQSVKPRSPENEADDNKKYTRQQSVKPRSPENEADDNKRLIRQQSVKPRDNRFSSIDDEDEDEL